MIPKNKKILYATDLSPSSANVLEFTVHLALQTGSTITVLHVNEDEPMRGRSILVSELGEDQIKRMKELNEEYTQQALIGKRKEIPIITEALMRLSQKTIDKVGTEIFRSYCR